MSIIKKYFKRWNGTGWDIVYFHSDASAVAQINASGGAYTGTAPDNSKIFFTEAERTKLAGIATGANNYTYTLPTASASTLGGIKVGTNLSIDANGVLSASQPTVPSAGTSASAVATSASGGSATTWSKSDHVHSISLATGDSNGQVKIAGSNVSVKGLAALAYKASLSASDIPDIGTTYVKVNTKGAASGVASLDSNGKIPTSQLPDTILGQLKFGGIVGFGSTKTGGVPDVLNADGSKPAGYTSDNYSWTANLYLSEAAKAALGTSDDTINLSTFFSNSATTGFYVIVASYSNGNSTTYTIKDITLQWSNSIYADGRTGSSADVHQTLQMTTGDWLVKLSHESNVIKVGKIDNTDAITSISVGGVSMGTGAVDITAANLTTAIGDYYAIKNHKSSSDVYGVGDYSDYGHLKLSNSQNQTGVTYSSSAGMAAPAGHTHSGYAASDHTHGITLATDTGNSSITLAHGSKYKLTAGGSAIIFTMPTDNNTNTWRPVKYGSTTLSDASTTLEFDSKGSVSLAFSSGKLTITGNSGITVADSAPSNPLTGDIWLSSSAS